MILLCERCWRPIDRTREPLRLIPRRVSDRSSERDATMELHAAVHARPCVAPDVGDWDPVRRGAAPAALHHAHERDDHR